MSQRRAVHACRKIADTGYAADFHAHMVSRYGFHYSTHADRTCPHFMEHLNFRRRLERRTRQLRINTLKQFDIIFLCRAPNNFLQIFIIHMRHIGESCSQLVNIRTDQGIRCKQGNMIPDQHQAARMKRRIDPAGSIGQKQNLCPHHFHQTGREHHVRNRIPFIIMYASLHQHHGDFIDITENKFPGMSRYCGNRKAFDFAVGKLSLHIHSSGKITKTGAEHYCHPGLKINFGFVTLVTS